MREIKFRTWDKKNKEMYYIGQEFDDEYGCAPYLEINKNGEWYWEWGDASDEFDLDNKIGILMQYTGLKDKNGKEIYEGDIVKGTWSDYSEKERPDLWTTMVIKFGEGEVDASDYEEYSIDIIGFYTEYLSGCDTRPSSILFYKKLEIIGNIHENKDLLIK